MGRKYADLVNLANRKIDRLDDVAKVIVHNRSYQQMEKLEYQDPALTEAAGSLVAALRAGKRIGLYADYDVDGTMSLVSWIWFLRAIGYDNYTYHIPCRFQEGYGLNLAAMEKMIHEDGIEVLVTMDTGITAKTEAAYCASCGVDFICTDHHTIQADKLPLGIIVNPRLNPNALYQHLCGCGITFVLLRQIGREFALGGEFWVDLLALAAIATICDVVPLNGVNHRIARMGIAGLAGTRRKVLRELMRSASEGGAKMDETDIGYRLGLRINAVGRLAHADLVVRAFLDDDPTAGVAEMNAINVRRRAIQEQIVAEALDLAEDYVDDPVLFMGSADWHAGVIGISASKVVEKYWKPTWLYQSCADGVCRGSARSVEGFDVTATMMECCPDLFVRYGGHAAAAGFSFLQQNEAAIRDRLARYAANIKKDNPGIWRSKIKFDCDLDHTLLSLSLYELIEKFRPFGHGFDAPLFGIDGKVQAIHHYKQKHTAVALVGGHRIMFFNEIIQDLRQGDHARFVINPKKSYFMERAQLSLMGRDYCV